MDEYQKTMKLVDDYLWRKSFVDELHRNNIIGEYAYKSTIGYISAELRREKIFVSRNSGYSQELGEFFYGLIRQTAKDWQYNED